MAWRVLGVVLGARPDASGVSGCLPTLVWCGVVDARRHDAHNPIGDAAGLVWGHLLPPHLLLGDGHAVRRQAVEGVPGRLVGATCFALLKSYMFVLALLPMAGVVCVWSGMNLTADLPPSHARMAQVRRPGHQEAGDEQDVPHRDEQVRRQVRGGPPHVGVERVDQHHRPLRLVPVYVQSFFSDFHSRHISLRNVLRLDLSYTHTITLLYIQGTAASGRAADRRTTPARSPAPTRSWGPRGACLPALPCLAALHANGTCCWAEIYDGLLQRSKTAH